MLSEFYFWLGASAEAETGSRADASSPQAVSTKGFDPARCEHPYSLEKCHDATGVRWHCTKCGVRL